MHRLALNFKRSPFLADTPVNIPLTNTDWSLQLQNSCGKLRPGPLRVSWNIRLVSAAYLLSRESYEVRPPWIWLVFPAYCIHVQLKGDQKNLETKSTTWTLCLIPQNIPEQNASVAGSIINKPSLSHWLTRMYKVFFLQYLKWTMLAVGWLLLQHSWQTSSKNTIRYIIHNKALWHVCMLCYVLVCKPGYSMLLRSSKQLWVRELGSLIWSWCGHISRMDFNVCVCRDFIQSKGGSVSFQQWDSSCEI